MYEISNDTWLITDSCLLKLFSGLLLNDFICSILMFDSGYQNKMIHFFNAKEKKMIILLKKFIIPQFFVIQLHLFNSPGSSVCGLCCCCAVLVTAGSLLRRCGEIKFSAYWKLSSTWFKESVREESSEFCDNDDDNEDKDEVEELLLSLIGYTLLSCLGKNIWFNLRESRTLFFFSIACLIT